MTNYFIVCTPFQRIVAEILANQISGDQTVCIDTTSAVEEGTKNGFDRVLNISSSFSDLIKIWKLRIELGRKLRSNEPINLFIPHLQTLFSSYFFKLATSNQNVQINVYYEGVAMFYNPHLETNRSTLIKRKFLGIISGFFYKNYSCLFTEELRKIATAYTPLPEFTKHFSKTQEFNFESLRMEITAGESTALILGGPMRSQDEVDHQLVRLKKLNEAFHLNENSLFKPHYSSKPELLKAFKNQWEKEGIQCELLMDMRPIEVIISACKSNRVFSIHPTSALINLSLMYGNKIQLYCFQDLWLNDHLSQIFSRLDITFLDDETETTKSTGVL